MNTLLALPEARSIGNENWHGFELDVCRERSTKRELPHGRGCRGERLARRKGVAGRGDTVLMHAVQRRSLEHDQGAIHVTENAGSKRPVDGEGDRAHPRFGRRAHSRLRRRKVGGTEVRMASVVRCGAHLAGRRSEQRADGIRVEIQRPVDEQHKRRRGAHSTCVGVGSWRQLAKECIYGPVTWQPNRCAARR